MATIPKIFHQIWIQGDMPEPYRYFRDHMLELHPGWEYKFWTEKNRPKLFNEEIYKSYEKYCFKSDILRYELLLKYGGIYVDSDTLFLKNIEPCSYNRLLLLIKGLNSNKINNNIMGCIQNHPFMQYIVYKIPESYERYQSSIKKSEMYDGLRTVGPRFIDRVIEEYMPEEISKAFDNKFFLPLCEKNPKKCEIYKYPEAYTLHFWNNGIGSSKIEIHKTLPCYKRKNNVNT